MEKFKHKKSLGQNFLKDENILRKIKDSVDVHEDDLIIEIGPGMGALTKYLKQFNCNVISFEIDERVKKYLDKLTDNKTKIIFEDFMKVDIKKIISEYKYKKLYVIANLPYYITTPIINKIIDSKLDVSEMVFMVQNEVANRFTAKPCHKDYGSITVYFNYYYEVEKLFFVGRKCFDPAPNVDSAVIKFIKKDRKLVVNNEKVFFDIVKASFAHKRKNIKNNLFNYDLKIIEEVLTKYGFSLSSRAEELPLQVFVDIANNI